jgi:hypothetical protein
VCLYSKIVKAGLYAAVGATANGYLEFVRKLNICPPEIIFFIYFGCYCVRIAVAENAGGSLAGGNGTDLCACSTKAQPVLCGKRLCLFYFIKRNTGHFNTLSACANKLAVTESF